jgi:hypothetical protein
LIFVEEIQLYLRLYNMPLANGDQTPIYMLDVLHHPKAPCDAREVQVDLLDITTKEHYKVLRGDGNNYLTFPLHQERRYEVVGQGFRKQICTVIDMVRAEHFRQTIYEGQILS